uniref:Uncharacterized protein n=1 Tax=Setaria viridis TaxID=4556 RepID=A0A4U6TUQ8_SETVI|nr:hypothetical protein SEVIR_7G164103v2 [Setaria viridis]
MQPPPREGPSGIGSSRSASLMGGGESSSSGEPGRVTVLELGARSALPDAGGHEIELLLCLAI